MYACDLARGIHEQHLSPFHYYGVTDEVSYETIPWRSGRFDAGELESRVATQSRWICVSNDGHLRKA